MGSTIRHLARFLFAAVTIGGEVAAVAQHYTFIDVPGGTNTFVNAINNAGKTVGRFDDSDGLTKAFLRDAKGHFRRYSIPNAVFTAALDVNDEGTVVGRYELADGFDHGFILRRGRLETVNFPGAVSTMIRGVDNEGNVMGNYSLTGEDEHGYIRDQSGFHTVDFPDSLTSDVWDRNKFGVEVGDYTDSTPDQIVHGFTLHEGHFATLDFPGSPVTSVRGINDAGITVAQFVDSDFFGHGFVKIPKRCFIQLDVSGASETLPSRINNANTISGYYIDPIDFLYHGFLLTDWQNLPCTDPQRKPNASKPHWTKQEQIRRMKR